MWSRLYRDHVIIAFPSYDTATQGWAPQAAISWWIGSSRGFEFVRFPNRFMTEQEAVSCALTMGQRWVDSRLSGLQRVSRPAPRRVIGMIDSLKQSLEKTSSKQPAPAQPETYTFEDFKSAVAKSGLRLSRQTLQRSYAALVKLRKNEHWSWAETRRKVENSRQDLNAAQLPRRRPRAALIPLTERDWRRIV